MNQFLQISKLNGSADDSIRPANSVNYVYIHGPLVDTGAGTATGTLTAATIPMTTVDMLLTGLHTITFSLTDFNTLRQLTGEALKTLDEKIDEILNVDHAWRFFRQTAASVDAITFIKYSQQSSTSN